MMPQTPTIERDTYPMLPPADTKRWSPSRKAAVVAAARTGLISRQEVCARYMMSDEELVAWERAYDQNGVPGLRTTRLQAYRYNQLEGARNQIDPGAGQGLQRYR
jgi:transposase-like protein